jgi:chromosome segregation ATPase
VAERISKREEDLRLAEELASTPGEDCANKRKKVDILLEEAQTQAQHKRKLEEELKQAMQPYKQIERELSGILKSQTAASTQLKRAKLSLQDAREQIIANASSAETEEARRTALLKQTEESLSAAQGRVDELKQEMAKWHRAYEEIEPHVLDAKGKVDSLDKRLNGVQHTLTSLQASTGQDILAILGPRVAKVASLVSHRNIVLV